MATIRPDEPTPIAAQFLRMSEVARLFDCSEITVKRMCASGQLRSVKVGRLRRVPLDALTQFGAVATR